MAKAFDGATVVWFGVFSVHFGGVGLCVEEGDRSGGRRSGCDGEAAERGAR